MNIKWMKCGILARWVRALDFSSSFYYAGGEKFCSIVEPDIMLPFRFSYMQIILTIIAQNSK